MGAYKFSLEKVLEWRVDNEKIVAKSFSILQSELQYQKTALNNLMLEDENIKKKVLKLRNIHDLKHQYSYKQSVERKIEQQLDLIDKTNTELEKLRLELLEAQKNRKIMEKLKEKDYISYKEELIYKEQKELDEMAVLKYGAAPLNLSS
ncbi:MAG: flagellar export protein FliJ [Tissierellaceae bacterium]|nr:flagellar export protein FliJ [Tissierellaceae bacterium]